MQYSLRCSILAHSNDVRAIATMDNCIISGSLDRTVKLWTETGISYEETTQISCHQKSVSAVCAISPSELFPSGLVFSAGHDKKILGFIMYSVEPSITLEGHSGAVCCLAPSLTKGHLLSSSWDGTAKLWDIVSGRCVTTYLGHTESVWCVIQMPGDFIVTASGDKLIKVHSLDGPCINTLKGHTDCVRGLTPLSQDIFLSCGNDGTIRKWNVRTGLNLESLTFHDHYLYSVAAQGSLVTFSGEGNHLAVWTDGTSFSERQVLRLPATSVWAVAVLPNSDIVTASSDGYIRIFTQDPSRIAPKDKMKEYENEFVKKTVTNGDAASEAQSLNLPGKEILANDGAFDGEIKLITENGTNYCYSWSAEKRTWELIGEQVQTTQNKLVYDGKEYDYVFSVDIADNREPLKLPYNKGENPIDVAQKFIIKNNLNPNFLDKIVSFLNENTGQNASNVPQASSSQQGFVLEPRTYYPPSKHVTFENYDFKLICKKLNDFMMTMNLLDEDALSIKNALQDLVDGKVETAADANPKLDILINAISVWPPEFVYPVLDITRILVRNPKVHPILLNNENSAKLLTALDRFMDPRALLNNKMFLFRIFSNMLSTPDGEKILFDNKEALLLRLPELISDQHKGLQVSACTFILNMSLTSINKKDLQASKSCAAFIQKICGHITDPEATFRMLVALGTIAMVDGSVVVSDNIRETLNTVSLWKTENPNCKAAKCADCILADFVPKPA